MLDCLKTALHELWESSRYTIPVNQGQLVQARLTDGGAFTLRDMPAKSPPAAEAPVGAARVGIVSPGPLEDLVAGEAASADQDEVLPASCRTAKTRPNKESPDGDVMDMPRESCSSVTEEEEPGHKREGRAKTSEDSKDRSARDGMATMPARSLDLEKNEAEDGQSATSRRAGNNRDDHDSKSNPAATGSNADTKHDVNSGKEQRNGPIDAERQDAGEAGSSARSVQSVQGREEGVTETGNPHEGSSTPSHTGDGTGASGKGTRGGSSACPRVSDALCRPLAYDMQRILGGCRRASRLKRKRDARNASADSFSAKLSGCGAKDEDSTAAARAFSRVLHKVSRVLVCHATESQGRSSLIARREIPVVSLLTSDKGFGAPHFLRFPAEYVTVVLISSRVTADSQTFPSPSQSRFTTTRFSAIT